MRLLLDIGNQQLDVRFEASDGRAQIVHGTRRYEAEASEVAPGIYLVIIEGRVYRCAVDRRAGGATEISVNGRVMTVEARDPKRLGRRKDSAGGAGGRAVLTAPMPGKVVRVARSVGDEVEAGEGVVVVEAMKMQNEVQSPRAGRVIEIRVTDGQTVNAGEVLAVIE